MTQIDEILCNPFIYSSSHPSSLTFQISGSSLVASNNKFCISRDPYPEVSSITEKGFVFYCKDGAVIDEEYYLFSKRDVFLTIDKKGNADEIMYLLPIIPDISVLHLFR